MKQLTVVIPNKYGQSPEITVSTLYMQDFTDFDIIIINDMDSNANIARNRGLAMVTTPYVLFSDNDINWHPEALALMHNFLQAHNTLSYAWGSYNLDGRIWCNKFWDQQALFHRNYISTMSMVRTSDHPGFDPNIKRLQDWDVWLTMLEHGKRGEYINRLIFTTTERNGITRNSIPLEEAIHAIKSKHLNVI